MDPYRTLGVEPSWTLDEIEARYRELMLQYHPDRHRQEGAETIAFAEQRTRLLNDAMGRLRKEHPAHGYAAATSSPTDGRSSGFAERDPSTWTTGPEGEDFGITYEWPPPPPEDRRRARQQPCPLCGDEFDELATFEAHLLADHGWDYRNARPGKTRRRRKRAHRGPRFSKSEQYLETAALITSIVFVLGIFWYRSQLNGVTRTFLDPILFGFVCFFAVVAFRLFYWRDK